MLRRLRSQLTYANVTASIALFLALTGGAYAMTVSHNSVRSSSIKNGQVKTADLANRAVTNSKLGSSSVNGPKIVNGSLTGGEFANNSITGDQIDESTLTLPNPPVFHSGNIDLPAMTANQQSTVFADPTHDGDQTPSSSEGATEVVASHDFKIKDLHFTIDPAAVGTSNSRAVRFEVNHNVPGFPFADEYICNFDGSSTTCDRSGLEQQVNTGDLLVIRNDNTGPTTGGQPWPEAHLFFSWTEGS